MQSNNIDNLKAIAFSLRAGSNINTCADMIEKYVWQLEKEVDFYNDDIRKMMDEITVTAKRMTYSRSCDAVTEGYALVIIDMAEQVLRQLKLLKDGVTDKPPLRDSPIFENKDAVTQN